ncbi:putative membrane protein [Fodinibius salinus]|uniref:Putative membrane protein n=1 Tax=Fodinibius salinus TaxID=860790 RepID=A0A5D3YK02_9BACT|nr:hypothetical protein [Fodinibius salinus]TYP93825.1 putative membrane protein [Fodinibius salinus]
MWLQPEIHRYIMATAFVVTGLLHFIRPQVFVKIMPDYIPWHLAMVYGSGVAELMGAIGILFQETRLWAGGGLILLLIAVFPANINMTIEAIEKTGYSSWYSIITIARLPLQFVLIYWVYWACLR